MKCEIWSCFCLFDHCCRSVYEREEYSQLVERIENVFDRPFWLLRIQEQFKPERRYVSCIDHCSRIMENLSLSCAQKEALRASCYLIDPENPIDSDERNTHCFQYYHEDRLTLEDFCLGCKSYFIALESFQLKKIVTFDGIVS